MCTGIRGNDANGLTFLQLTVRDKVPGYEPRCGQASH
jgi:hypothetical protein